MSPHLLRRVRIALALVFFCGLTLAFLDFRSQEPHRLAHLFAHAQFTPALISLIAGGLGTVFFTVGIIIALCFGRVYCSAICPLGILQDIISRVARWLPGRKKRFLPYARPHPVIRHAFLWGTVIAMVAGWSGFAWTLLDPYSNFGRIFSTLLRPLVTLANNALVGVANASGIQSLYRVEPTWVAAGAIALPAVFLTIVAVMSALRGRLYCNTVCPVGTTLGLVSKISIFRMGIDKGACRKCGECLRHCKAQCIDLKTGTIDASRCVACYDCIGVCDDHGIGYQFAWKRHAKKEPAAPAKASAASPDRRQFLATVAGGVAATAGALAASKASAAGTSSDSSTLAVRGEAAPAICPPGSAGVERFLDRCTACNLCVSACPTHVLQPSFLQYGLEGLLRPRLDYTSSFCLFECTRCGEICPDGAIDLLDLARKQQTQIGVADFYRERCIVEVNGTDCAACSEHCPTKAVYTVPYGDNLRLPELNQDLCVGCGACEYACPVKPVKAIVVTGRRIHGTAKKLTEPKATAPKPAGDFPF